MFRLRPCRSSDVRSGSLAGIGSAWRPETRVFSPTFTRLARRLRRLTPTLIPLEQRPGPKAAYPEMNSDFLSVWKYLAQAEGSGCRTFFS